MTSDFSLLAIIAAGAALWSQLRALLERVRALFVTRVTLHGQVAEAVTHYLFSQGRVINWGDRFVRSTGAYVRPLERVAEVAFESAPLQPLICLLQRRPLLFHCPRNTVHGNSLPENFNVIVLSALRGTLDITTLTRAALDHSLALQTTGRRYFVRRCGGSRHPRESGNQVTSAGSPPHATAPETLDPNARFLHWTRDQIGAPRPEHPFAALALDATSEAARTEFRQWLELKAWYQKRGIPWRRGFLFYGTPGTGKTSLARALAQEADIPVFTYDLSTLGNEEFLYHWRDMQEHAPCMALIEDIDGTFDGRKNVVPATLEKGGVLSFDCLLNATGGIETADGVFLVVTTNHEDKVDPALKRPGRLDRHFCIQPLSAAARRQIITRILDDCTEADISATEGETAAQVTDYAVQKALAKLEATYQNPS